MTTLTPQLLIIGWGKAGKTLAGRAADAGWEVVLVERSPQMYGGTCINIGCVPTKDLIVSAEAKRAGDDPAAYFRESVESRDALIRKLNAANYAMLADREEVTLLDGEARFVGPHEVVVDTHDGEVRVNAEYIVVNTGTMPRPLDIPGADGPRVFDSTTIQHIDPFPKHLTIIGAGFIGCEFANMFSLFGSKVTMLDAGPEFLPRLDRDVADAVSALFVERGIEVQQNAKVTGIGADGSVSVGDTIDSDAVLIAAGRTPATAGLGLEEAGIATDERGFILVDDQLRTSVDNVFATGDVNGGPQFTYISLDDFRIVADALFGPGARRRSDRVAVPNATFITPPLATVGLNEAEARDSGRNVLVGSLPVANIAVMPRPKIVGETHGIIKLLVDADSDELLGATVFSIDAQEVINLLALAIRSGTTATELRDGIWTHPSSTEALNGVLNNLRPL